MCLGVLLASSIKILLVRVWPVGSKIVLLPVHKHNNLLFSTSCFYVAPGIPVLLPRALRAIAGGNTVPLGLPQSPSSEFPSRFPFNFQSCFLFHTSAGHSAKYNPHSPLVIGAELAASKYESRTNPDGFLFLDSVPFSVSLTFALWNGIP